MSNDAVEGDLTYVLKGTNSMQSRWINRRAHIRHLPHGGLAYVRQSWALLHSTTDSEGGSYRKHCQTCGAPIISVNMPKGGWVHFEGAKGLERIKHPCLQIGEGLSSRRDDQTLDLFDEVEKQKS